jgi:hypothetical protein
MISDVVGHGTLVVYCGSMWSVGGISRCSVWLIIRSSWYESSPIHLRGMMIPVLFLTQLISNGSGCSQRGVILIMCIHVLLLFS